MKENLDWVLQNSLIPAAILEWHDDTQSFLIGFMFYSGLKVGLSVEPNDTTDKRTILADLQTLYFNATHNVTLYRR